MKDYFARLAAAAVRGALKEADKMIADVEKAVEKKMEHDVGPRTGDLPLCKVCNIYHLYPNSSACVEKKHG